MGKPGRCSAQPSTLSRDSFGGCLEGCPLASAMAVNLNSAIGALQKPALMLGSGRLAFLAAQLGISIDGVVRRPIRRSMSPYVRRL
jgi:hypothetical protein